MADPGRVAEPSTARMVERIRMQADACRDLGSALYCSLLSRLADDVEAGGPAREVLRGQEEATGPSAFALRLMGGVHRLVLEGRAPALALTYPSVGGSGDAEAAWAALRDLLAEQRDELRGYLDRPPQTNEVARSAALVGGLLHLAADDHRPVRLVEIGASAGLNLRGDRFLIELPDGRSVGPRDSPVVLHDPWRGPAPPLGRPLEVVERMGCDLAPVDPTTAEGRLLLMSYVWPDQHERLERLRGALDVAARVPARLETAGAADFLGRLRLREGTTTVVWHSIMWQYLDGPERARAGERLEQLGAEASGTAGFAHLMLEPRRERPDSAYRFLVTLRTWPGGDERILATASPHGVPVVWQ